MDWYIYSDSRISRLQILPLRVFALVLRNIYELGSSIIARINLSPYRKLVDDKYAETIDLAVYYVRSSYLEGDIGEFGSHGTTACVVARQLAYYSVNKSLHLFDSFEGFPEPEAKEDLESHHVCSGVWRKGSSAGWISPDKLFRKLEKTLPQQIKIYKGYYKDTLPTISSQTKFAMLIMDCCLYQSHYEVLKYLFEHRMIVDGAIILFSDWNANAASPLRGSRKAWDDILKDFDIIFSDEGTYSWGGRKFIVHSYNKKSFPK